MDRRIDRVFIYILTNKIYGTLYIGLTTNLVKRIEDHKNKTVKGFTKKYNLTKLVYYEIHDTIEEAAQRERLMKKWKRDWKIELIEKANPNWHDLHEDLMKKVVN